MSSVSGLDLGLEGPHDHINTHAQRPYSHIYMHRHTQRHIYTHVHVTGETSEEDVHFSFAPLCHITERIMVLYALRKGMAIGFSQVEY